LWRMPTCEILLHFQTWNRFTKSKTWTGPNFKKFLKQICGILRFSTKLKDGQ
jgi:hypothetical protein